MARDAGIKETRADPPGKAPSVRVLLVARWLTGGLPCQHQPCRWLGRSAAPAGMRHHRKRVQIRRGKAVIRTRWFVSCFGLPCQHHVLPMARAAPPPPPGRGIAENACGSAGVGSHPYAFGLRPSGLSVGGHASHILLMARPAPPPPPGCGITENAYGSAGEGSHPYALVCVLLRAPMPASRPADGSGRSAAPAGTRHRRKRVRIRRGRQSSVRVWLASLRFIGGRPCQPHPADGPGRSAAPAGTRHHRKRVRIRRGKAVIRTRFACGPPQPYRRRRQYAPNSRDRDAGDQVMLTHPAGSHPSIRPWPSYSSAQSQPSPSLPLRPYSVAPAWSSCCT